MNFIQPFRVEQPAANTALVGNHQDAVKTPGQQRHSSKHPFAETEHIRPEHIAIADLVVNYTIPVKK